MSGEACRWWVVVIPIGGEDTVEAAYRDAMSNSPPETTGLADLRITLESTIPPVLVPATILARRYCIRVTGVPARRLPLHGASLQR